MQNRSHKWFKFDQTSHKGIDFADREQIKCNVRIRTVPSVFKYGQQTFNARLTDGTQFALRRERLRFVQGPAQEAAEGLDGRRYAFVNDYETNYIVGGTGDRCEEYFYKFQLLTEETNKVLYFDPRLEDASSEY